MSSGRRRPGTCNNRESLSPYMGLDPLKNYIVSSFLNEVSLGDFVHLPVEVYDAVESSATTDIPETTSVFTQFNICVLRMQHVERLKQLTPLHPDLEKNIKKEFQKLKDDLELKKCKGHIGARIRLLRGNPEYKRKKSFIDASFFAFVNTDLYDVVYRLKFDKPGRPDPLGFNFIALPDNLLDPIKKQMDDLCRLTFDFTLLPIKDLNWENGPIVTSFNRILYYALLYDTVSSLFDSFVERMEDEMLGSMETLSTCVYGMEALPVSQATQRYLYTTFAPMLHRIPGFKDTNKIPLKYVQDKIKMYGSEVGLLYSFMDNYVYQPHSTNIEKLIFLERLQRAQRGRVIEEAQTHKRAFRHRHVSSSGGGVGGGGGSSLPALDCTAYNNNSSAARSSSGGGGATGSNYDDEYYDDDEEEDEGVLSEDGATCVIRQREVFGDPPSDNELVFEDVVHQAPENETLLGSGRRSPPASSGNRRRSTSRSGGRRTPSARGSGTYDDVEFINVPAGRSVHFVEPLDTIDDVTSSRQNTTTTTGSRSSSRTGRTSRGSASGYDEDEDADYFVRRGDGATTPRSRSNTPTGRSNSRNGRTSRSSSVGDAAGYDDDDNDDDDNDDDDDGRYFTREGARGGSSRGRNTGSSAGGTLFQNNTLERQRQASLERRESSTERPSCVSLPPVPQQPPQVESCPIVFQNPDFLPPVGRNNPFLQTTRPTTMFNTGPEFLVAPPISQVNRGVTEAIYANRSELTKNPSFCLYRQSGDNNKKKSSKGGGGSSSNTAAPPAGAQARQQQQQQPPMPLFHTARSRPTRSVAGGNKQQQHNLLIQVSSSDSSSSSSDEAAESPSLILLKGGKKHRRRPRSKTKKTEKEVYPPKPAPLRPVSDIKPPSKSPEVGDLLGLDFTSLNLGDKTKDGGGGITTTRSQQQKNLLSGGLFGTSGSGAAAGWQPQASSLTSATQQRPSAIKNNNGSRHGVKDLATTPGSRGVVSSDEATQQQGGDKMRRSLLRSPTFRPSTGLSTGSSGQRVPGPFSVGTQRGSGGLGGTTPQQQAPPPPILQPVSSFASNNNTFETTFRDDDDPVFLLEPHEVPEQAAAMMPPAVSAPRHSSFQTVTTSSTRTVPTETVQQRGPFSSHRAPITIVNGKPKLPSARNTFFSSDDDELERRRRIMRGEKTKIRLEVKNQPPTSSRGIFSLRMDSSSLLKTNGDNRRGVHTDIQPSVYYPLGSTGDRRGSFTDRAPPTTPRTVCRRDSACSDDGASYNTRRPTARQVVASFKQQQQQQQQQQQRQVAAPAATAYRTVVQQQQQQQQNGPIAAQCVVSAPQPVQQAMVSQAPPVSGVQQQQQQQPRVFVTTNGPNGPTTCPASYPMVQVPPQQPQTAMVVPVTGGPGPVVAATTTKASTTRSILAPATFTTTSSSSGSSTLPVQGATQQPQQRTVVTTTQQPQQPAPPAAATTLPPSTVPRLSDPKPKPLSTKPDLSLRDLLDVLNDARTDDKKSQPTSKAPETEQPTTSIFTGQPITKTKQQAPASSSTTTATSSSTATVPAAPAASAQKTTTTSTGKSKTGATATSSSETKAGGTGGKTKTTTKKTTKKSPGTASTTAAAAATTTTSSTAAQPQRSTTTSGSRLMTDEEVRDAEQYITDTYTSLFGNTEQPPPPPPPPTSMTQQQYDDLFNPRPQQPQPVAQPPPPTSMSQQQYDDLFNPRPVQQQQIVRTVPAPPPPTSMTQQQYDDLFNPRPVQQTVPPPPTSMTQQQYDDLFNPRPVQQPARITQPPPPTSMTQQQYDDLFNPAPVAATQVPPPPTAYSVRSGMSQQQYDDLFNPTPVAAAAAVPPPPTAYSVRSGMSQQQYDDLFNPTPSVQQQYSVAQAPTTTVVLTHPHQTHHQQQPQVVLHPQPPPQQYVTPPQQLPAVLQPQPASVVVMQQQPVPVSSGHHQPVPQPAVTCPVPTAQVQQAQSVPQQNAPLVDHAITCGPVLAMPQVSEELIRRVRELSALMNAETFGTDETVPRHAGTVASVTTTTATASANTGSWRAPRTQTIESPMDFVDGATSTESMLVDSSAGGTPLDMILGGETPLPDFDMNL
nr:ORF-C [Elephant endotheliotropic herpesvirus 4A]